MTLLNAHNAQAIADCRLAAALMLLVRWLLDPVAPYLFQPQEHFQP